MSRVVLTGATGFIGRHALDTLLAQGHEVHALGRTRGADARGVTWHEADLLEGSGVVEEVQPEILVHLAWYAEHGKFWSSPENVRWVEASLALLRSFARVGGRRAVIAGTCAEYEWSRDVYQETAPLGPGTLYGAAKQGLHVVSSAFAEQAGVSLAWGRVFFVYGPFEAPGRFVPSIVLPLLRGDPAPMTEGSQRRDLMHAADVGAAFAALAESDVTGAVNLASGTGVTLREVAEKIAHELDREELLQVGAHQVREGDPPALIADVGRLREEVGWRPAIGLGDGLAEVIDWWREWVSVQSRHG
jgi:nucleoside-diphosphate-sugar epimerase